MEAMSYFGLIDLDWWLILLAYVGTALLLLLSPLWLLTPDTGGRTHTWLAERNRKVTAGMAKARHRLGRGGGA
jgi:hypothetical protein